MNIDGSITLSQEVVDEVERVRSRARDLQRKRRHAMTAYQRNSHLAKRRSNYKILSASSENEQTQNHASDKGTSYERNNTTTRTTTSLLLNEESNSCSYTSNINLFDIDEGAVVGMGHCIPLDHFPFPSNIIHSYQHEASTSRAHATTTTNDEPFVALLGDAYIASNCTALETTELRHIDPNEASYSYLPRTDCANLHNIARYYNEIQGIQQLQLKLPRICEFCQARLFEGENDNFCCNKGHTLLPAIPVPQELLNLFTSQSAEGRSFRKNIRKYNHVFSFTSIGVTLDKQVVNGPGVHNFRAHGSVYHRIGTLLPHSGDRPRYLQMFIYDTEHETDNRLRERTDLNRNLIQQIKRILDVHNPFVKTCRQLAQRPDLTHCQLLIKARPIGHRQYVVPTESQVAAIISTDADLQSATNRDIVVQTTGGRFIRVKEFAGYYDPLQYPLFLPYGTYGWDAQSHTIHGRRVTCCDYYAYMLQIRNNPSILLYGGWLLHQYIVDNYVKIETQRLTYIRTHQDTIRAELYQGLHDCLHAGETDASNAGRRIVLPSSYVGSPRDVYQRFQDAMAVVRKLGKPDIFLTMTCNPNWKEIHDELLPGQTPQDRPDLLTRVFRAKYEKLKRFIYKRNILGKVIGYVHVVEFQKRGLPHVHMLVMIHDNDKPTNPDDYDAIVCAEIPNKEEQPLLYEAVLKHMIHGPCGIMNPNAPCMKDRTTCKKNFPKQFQPCTIQGNDSYPLYRRRDDNRYVSLDANGDRVIDNRWVVPYNPWLLLKFNCHINIEICSSVKSIKYLYKYVHKGPDFAEVELRSGKNYDEIQKYVDGRWICAPEALWKTFKFPITRIYPTVVRLQLHLPNLHQVHYDSRLNISEVINNERNQRTMLTEFFRVYEERREVVKYLYTDFPIYYRWDASSRKWEKRKTTQKVIGRIYAASPAEGERFYLRLLLNHVGGPTSFDDLLTVNHVRYNTYRQAAEKFGILEDDDSIRQCLQEARTVKMPIALRRLFATILVFCEPVGVRTLWDENFSYMIEDYHVSLSTNTMYAQNRLLHDINTILLQHNRSVTEFDIPQITELFQFGRASNLVEEELSIPISEQDLNSVTNLNPAQLLAFTTITNAISTNENALFFVDGPGGTGKTFLYTAILASSRKNGHIVLATATSGIAANQLPGGRTAHSRFRIPIRLDSRSLCSISKQSDLCQLILRASAIIWDEAPMANKIAIETVDRTFRDLLSSDLPFGGKVMIFGGDFRQVVPVVVGGTRTQTIQASMITSHLWPFVKVLKLVENIRAREDPDYSHFVLRVGNGEEPTVTDDMIRIPDSMVIPWQSESNIDEFITSIFPEMENHMYDIDYMMNRAIITPLNEDVNKLNDRVIRAFHGADDITYYSFDSVSDDNHNMYLPEFLHSLSPGNLPPHKLTLKKGCPLMCLRNLDPKIGLCNGTRLLCHRFGTYFIDAEIFTGEFKGTRVFLPRIPLQTSEDTKLPFQLTRKQFPVRLGYALTINKSQGQTIPHVGIFLPNHVFSHGQLYVALSRGISKSTTKLLIKNGRLDSHQGVFTRNIIYHEIFTHLDPHHNQSTERHH